MKDAPTSHRYLGHVTAFLGFLSLSPGASAAQSCARTALGLAASGQRCGRAVLAALRALLHACSERAASAEPVTGPPLQLSAGFCVSARPSLLEQFLVGACIQVAGTSAAASSCSMSLPRVAFYGTAAPVQARASALLWASKSAVVVLFSQPLTEIEIAAAAGSTPGDAGAVDRVLDARFNALLAHLTEWQCAFARLRPCPKKHPSITSGPEFYSLSHSLFSLAYRCSLS